MDTGKESDGSVSSNFMVSVIVALNSIGLIEVEYVAVSLCMAKEADNL